MSGELELLLRVPPPALNGAKTNRPGIRGPAQTHRYRQRLLWAFELDLNRNAEIRRWALLHELRWNYGSQVQQA